MPVESTTRWSGIWNEASIISSLPQSVPTAGSSLAVSIRLATKVGSSSTSGLSVRTQSPAREGDGLVLSRGKPDVFLVVNDRAAFFETLQDVGGAVGGGIVDDDDFQPRVALLEHGLQATANKAPAVVGDDRHGDEIFFSHELQLDQDSTIGVAPTFVPTSAGRL